MRSGLHILFILPILILCAPSDTAAQNSSFEKCRLSFIVPDGFAQVMIDEELLTYHIPRSNTSFAMSKTIHDTRHDMYTAKSVAMVHFNQVFMIDENFGVEMVEEEVNDHHYVIIKWYTRHEKRGMTYNVVAYNDDCDLIYKIRMCTEGRHQAEMDDTFTSILETVHVSRK